MSTMIFRLTSEAIVFETGTDKWKPLTCWPPSEAVEKRLFLAESGKISFEDTSATGNDFDEYISDPNKPVPYTSSIFNKKQHYGRTPLCAVARDGGNVETMKTLISLGADINTKDYWDWTPIMLAAWRPNKEVADVLLDAGADLQVGTASGEQLLVDAVSSGLE